MSALDTFQNFASSLSPKEREHLKALINRGREDLLAARSEEARVRLVEAMIQEVRAFTTTTRR